jgi:hypothetical protein
MEIIFPITPVGITEAVSTGRLSALAVTTEDFRTGHWQTYHFRQEHTAIRQRR